MKRLWKYIPPCLPDVLGFQAVMDETDGLGIVDDPGTYKPLSIMGVGNSQPGYLAMDGREKFGQKSGSSDERGFTVHGGKYKGNKNYDGRKGHGGRKRSASGLRVVNSELRNEDIISGTEHKIIQAFEEAKERLMPKFVLLSNAPSSSMISSDLESAADKIGKMSGIPAGSVKIYGDKDYLYGVSLTLEAIGRLLLKPRTAKPGTVNILGCNIIDWSNEAVDAFSAAIEASGATIISKWGAGGMKSEELKMASAASLNLVVNISGLRLAKYMKDEFGIPYIVGAPFGKAQLSQLLDSVTSMLKGDAKGDIYIGINTTPDETSKSGNKQDSPDYCEALVIGEQLAANAIRRMLRERGFDNIRVLSFFDMDKSCMEENDKKITSEDELANIASADGLKVIFADPDYKPAVKADVRWVNLPNSGMSVVTRVPQANMVGYSLDNMIA
ncbi:MAG: nitrogenase component 1 [Lachnospiraceae bacterium]